MGHALGQHHIGQRERAAEPPGQRAHTVIAVTAQGGLEERHVQRQATKFQTDRAFIHQLTIASSHRQGKRTGGVVGIGVRPAYGARSTAARRGRIPDPSRRPGADTASVPRFGQLALFGTIPPADPRPVGPKLGLFVRLAPPRRAVPQIPPACPSLALFFRSLLQVRCTITPFRPSLCSSFCSGGNWLCLAPSCPRGLSRPPTPNWVCLAHLPLVPRPSGLVPPGYARNWLCFAHLPRGWQRQGLRPWRWYSPPGCRKLGLFGAIIRRSAGSAGGSPVPRPRGPSRQIGFVFPKPIARAMYHNSFPANHLPFALPWPKLGLFGAEAPRPPSLWPRPARRSRANWVRLT